MIEVTIKLIFREKTVEFEIQPNGVPPVLIGQSLEDIVEELYDNEIKDAKQVVGDADMTKYLEARIAVDRKKLDRLLKEKRDVGEGDEW